MAPQDGLEPPAYRLTAGCSTIELLRNTTIKLVELNGIEPMTSCLQGRRSPN